MQNVANEYEQNYAYSLSYINLLFYTEAWHLLTLFWTNIMFNAD